MKWYVRTCATGLGAARLHFFISTSSFPFVLRAFSIESNIIGANALIATVATSLGTVLFHIGSPIDLKYVLKKGTFDFMVQERQNIL